MKMCIDHWTRLKDAIAVRGMWHLVAKDGRQAIQNTVLELEGRSREAFFDPLMAAHWMIVNAAQERIGMALMFGDKCPVCEGIAFNLEAQKHATNDSIGRALTPDEELSYWIDGPAQAVLRIAQDRGAMPRAMPPERA